MSFTDKSLLSTRLAAHNDRPSSVPPSRLMNGQIPDRPSSIPPQFSRHQRTMSDPQNTDETDGVAAIDVVDFLQRSVSSVVKTRSGSVLSRGFILKTDFYPSGRAMDLDLNLHGAPNFRSSRQGSLNVFGVAQPRTQGLRAILSVLRCRPNTPKSSHVVWFSTREEPIIYISGRPFVLRDASEPRRTFSLSDRAENLEAIELRLKNDILQEAARYGGLVLTHNEMAADSGEGAILATWTAVDHNNVKTQRELMNYMKQEGWNVDYYRIPVSPDRLIEDNYLDAYVGVIKDTDPRKTALVFCCGMGAVRTTFGMVAASIVRRKQLLNLGLDDPFSMSVSNGSILTPGFNTPPSESKIMQTMEQLTAQQDLSKSLLRLTYILQQTLQNKNAQSAIELLMTRPSLLENLRKAHMGNYSIILSLLGCLDHGISAKKLVDRVIDNTDHVTNLREDIVIHRLNYSMAMLDDNQGSNLLGRAVKALEKYFFLISFASYVDGCTNFKTKFSDWLKTRTEIWNQLMFLRKSHRTQLNVFAPISDLSSLSKTGLSEQALTPGKKNDIAITGGRLTGDEYSNYVVRNRSGIILRASTLLKSDQWYRESMHVDHEIRGAINFRRIPGTKIYALGQPTLEAIDEVVRHIKANHSKARRILWLALREEPIVYVNGAPYCLRREGFSLRNMKDYGGISASRLQVLEDRLKDDVIAELNADDGRVLLHTETHDGTVIPIWEEAKNYNVAVLSEVMAERRLSNGVELLYDRIPITAERSPDFSDLSELINVMLRNSSNTPIVVNCQLGRGRSTLASIILLLIRQWLESHRGADAPTTPRIEHRNSVINSRRQAHDSESDVEPKYRHSYQVINNLLRVIRKGPAVKNTVDDAIDQCAVIYNMRESIEESRAQAEQATDDRMKRVHTQKGLQNLRRYFELIVFQWYLQSIEPNTIDDVETIETFVKNRPVIKTFEKDLREDGLNALKPLERTDVMNGVAHPDDVDHVVLTRSGSILSASTILKSDFFSNLQKMSLPERIEGAPNFRRIPLTLQFVTSGKSSPTNPDFEADQMYNGKMVCGSGMPTVNGLRRALERVDADPKGKNFVVWTSLREEPVIYVAGRPHVLRLVDKPLENVEATGVTTVVVESMEKNFKRDVVRELRAGNGRVLLHDEVEERPGVFSIIPIWETVTEQEIMTPREVFELMRSEGYKLDYGRVAITDEQAPLPGALWELLQRIRSGLSMSHAGDFIFNCQMGRGRTTTGMVAACLVSTTVNWKSQQNNLLAKDETVFEPFDTMDGPSEEEAYLQGEYKTILQLVSVLSHGKVAKRLADRAIDLMQDVQNLRKAIYDYKLKVDACERGSAKHRKLSDLTVNYLYRYGMLIVFADYLIGMQEQKDDKTTFPAWLEEHREITKLLKRKSLD